LINKITAWTSDGKQVVTVQGPIKPELLVDDDDERIVTYSDITSEEISFILNDAGS